MHISTFPPHYLLICLQRLLTTWVWSTRNRMKITSTWPVQLTAYFQSPTSTCLGEKGEQQQPSMTWGREDSPTKVIPMGGPSHVLPCQHKKTCAHQKIATLASINNNNNEKKIKDTTTKKLVAPWEVGTCISACTCSRRQSRNWIPILRAFSFLTFII